MKKSKITLFISKDISLIYYILYFILYIMTQNQIVKSLYHLLAALLILFIALRVKNIHITVKILLIAISIFHFYDVWWFFKNDGNAPI